jgi:hypothetical protein
MLSLRALATRGREGLAIRALAAGFTQVLAAVPIPAPVAERTPAPAAVRIRVLAAVRIQVLAVAPIPVPEGVHIPVQVAAHTPARGVARTPVQEGLATLVPAVRPMINGTAPLPTVNEPINRKEKATIHHGME